MFNTRHKTRHGLGREHRRWRGSPGGTPNNGLNFSHDNLAHRTERPANAVLSVSANQGGTNQDVYISLPVYARQSNYIDPSTMNGINDWKQLPQQPLYHYPHRPVHAWHTTSRSKSIRDFSYPREALLAIKDALCDHKKAYLESNKLHGNISLDTIRIGHNPNAHSSAGFLGPPQMHLPDPTFQSFRSLSHLIGRKITAPLDYLDDLESFFYVTAYLGYAYESDGGTKPVKINQAKWATPLARWASRPLDRTSIVDKEMTVQNSGIAYEGVPVSSLWGGPAFQVYVLNEMGICLSRSYLDKIDRDTPLTLGEYLAKATDDYDCFISVLDKYLKHFPQFT